MFRTWRNPGKLCLVPFSCSRREAILNLGEGRPVTTGEISQLNFLLGEIFADAALAACRKFKVPPSQIAVIGSHGQTVFHQGVFTILRPTSSVHIADWRPFRDCEEDGDYHSGRSPSGRYGCWRARRTPRSPLLIFFSIAMRASVELRSISAGSPT